MEEGGEGESFAEVGFHLEHEGGGEEGVAADLEEVGICVEVFGGEECFPGFEESEFSVGAGGVVWGGLILRRVGESFAVDFA
ncbi:MAG: hypothetical protein RI897_1487 [Verrucomicrobiota bacterium]